MILSRSYISSSSESLPAAHSMMVIVLIQLVSPIVLTIRPPACTWDNWCDQKLMIDLEWWICKAMQCSLGKYLQKLFPKKNTPCILEYWENIDGLVWVREILANIGKQLLDYNETKVENVESGAVQLLCGCTPPKMRCSCGPVPCIVTSGERLQYYWS